MRSIWPGFLKGRVAPKPNVTNVAAMRPVVANAAASTSSAVPPRRNRSGMLPSKSAAIRRAMKSGQVKQKANKLRMPRGPLYVGNLRPHVTVEHLRAFFSSCGKVVDVQVRSSLGRVTIDQGNELPASDGTPNHVYATVVLATKEAKARALALHGSWLEKCRLVVSRSVLNLPELQHLAQVTMDETRVNRGLPAHLHKYRGRPLKREDTVKIFEDHRPVNLALGVSFPKCVL